MKFGTFLLVDLRVLQHPDNVLDFLLDLIDALDVVEALLDILGSFDVEFKLAAEASIIIVVGLNKVVERSEGDSQHDGSPQE